MKNIVKGPYECGETPLWDKSRKILFWVDASAHTIHSWAPDNGRMTRYAPPVEVTALREAGTDKEGEMVFLLLTKWGLYSWIPEGGAGGTILAGQDILENTKSLRFNDGVPLGDGRFAAGAFDEADLYNGRGALMIIDLAGDCQILDEGLHVPNGLAYSPRQKTLYMAEMYQYRILKYSFSREAPETAAREVFLEIPREEGKPDGLLLDHEDNLWVAHWRGWSISRYNQEGMKTRSIATPFATPTCFCFGVTEQEMYITTATLELEADEMARSLLPGGIFKTEFDGIHNKIL